MKLHPMKSFAFGIARRWFSRIGLLQCSLALLVACTNRSDDGNVEQTKQAVYNGWLDTVTHPNVGVLYVNGGDTFCTATLGSCCAKCAASTKSSRPAVGSASTALKLGLL